MDLHDDLQSFMYTSGNFFARKDLSAYMGKAFVEEIAREEVRDEQYRKIKGPGGSGLDAFDDLPPRKEESPKAANMSRPGVSRPPPPPPPRPQRPSYPSSKPPPPPPTSNVQSMSQPVMSSGPNLDMDWDEEELATHVYDKPDISSPGMMAPGGPAAPSAGPPPGASRPAPLSPVSAPPVASAPMAAPPPAGMPSPFSSSPGRSSPGQYPTPGMSSPGIYSTPQGSYPGSPPGPLSSPGLSSPGLSGSGYSSPGGNHLRLTSRRQARSALTIR